MRSLTALWLVTSLALAGCFDAHGGSGPKGSTETGNPPAIDSSLVALVVTKDEVHLTGDAGAVTPGGSELTARNLTSMKVVKGKAESDGSFDLRVDGTPYDAFELRAGSGKLMSLPLFVDRGGAIVSETGMLSCEQRQNEAYMVLTDAVGRADTDCATDDDCVLTSPDAVCHDACTDMIVSRTGKAEVDAVIGSINAVLCGEYKSDGCVLPKAPCTGTGPAPMPACVEKKCQQRPADTAALSCSERWTQANDAFIQALAMADLNCVTSSDCTLVNSTTDCGGGCDSGPVSLTGKAQVAEAVAGINAGVCANYMADGCPVGGPMCAAIPTPVCYTTQTVDPNQNAVFTGQCTDLKMLTCDDRIAAAELELNRARNLADKTCTTDADCVSSDNRTDCFVGCAGDIVSQKGQTEVATEIDLLNNGLCAHFIADGCFPPVSDCTGPPVPACINGTCSAKPASSP